MAVLLAALAVAAAAGWRIEYSAYANAGGTQSVYVRGKVRTTRNADVSVPVEFDRGANTSSLQGTDGDEYPLYFDHVGFVLPAYSDVPQGIAFQDFEAGAGGGVYMGMGSIGSGSPEPHTGSRVLARTECSGPVETCLFEGTMDGERFVFYVSMTQTYHSIPKRIADTIVRIDTQHGGVVVDTREYNAYEDVFDDQQNVAIVSIPYSRMTVWQNSTHVEIWEQPNAMNSMQDLLSMFLMVGALVAIVDISIATTSRMSTVPWTANDVTWLTRVVIFDIVSSAAFIVGYRIYQGHAFIDTRVHGIETRSKDLNSAVALAAIVMATLVIGTTVLDSKRPFLEEKAAWWAWSRGGFEASVVLAASSSAPSVVGGSFVLAMRFATGMVAVAVIGRDTAFVARTAGWKLSAVVFLHAALFEWTVAETLVEPVFWLSQSFPQSRGFTRMIAHVVVVCTALAASGTLHINTAGKRDENGCSYVQVDGQDFSML